MYNWKLWLQEWWWLIIDDWHNLSWVICVQWHIENCFRGEFMSIFLPRWIIAPTKIQIHIYTFISALVCGKFNYVIIHISVHSLFFFYYDSWDLCGSTFKTQAQIQVDLKICPLVLSIIAYISIHNVKWNENLHVHITRYNYLTSVLYYSRGHNIYTYYTPLGRGA